MLKGLRVSGLGFKIYVLWLAPNPEMQGSRALGFKFQGPGLAPGRQLKPPKAKTSCASPPPEIPSAKLEPDEFVVFARKQS